MTLINRGYKNARTVCSGKERSSRLIAIYCQISHCDRRHWLKKEKNIPENQADNERAENSHAIVIILRGICIRKLFLIGLLNCSTVGKWPAIAQPSYIFLGWLLYWIPPSLNGAWGKTHWSHQHLCLSFCRLKLRPLGSCLGAISNILKLIPAVAPPLQDRS